MQLQPMFCLLIGVVIAFANSALAQTDALAAPNDPDGAVPQSASGREDSQEDGPPVCRFDQAYVCDWLLLGPVKRGSELEAPLSLLEGVAEGQEVQFTSGLTRRWTRVTTPPNGLVRLGDYCRKVVTPEEVELDPDYGSANHMVVYAYCRIEPDAPFRRQLLVGMDDGARAWLDRELVIDDVRADWMVPFEHRIEIDGRRHQTQHLLLELHNWTGNFMFSCAAGYSMHGRVVYLDQTTPAAEQVVELSVEGEPNRVAYTNAAGRYRIEPVPFNRDLSLRCGSRQYHVEALPDPLDQSTPSTRLLMSPRDSAAFQEDVVGMRVDFVATPSALPDIEVTPIPVPAGEYSAITETAKGVVLFANNTNRVIYCFDGLRTDRHPSADLHGFTSERIQCMSTHSDGTIWIGTFGDGLYRWREDGLKHWQVEQLGGDCRTLFVSASGTLWASFTDSSIRKKRHRVFKIPDGSDELTELDIEFQSEVLCIQESHGEIAILTSYEPPIFLDEQTGEILEQLEAPIEGGFAAIADGPEGERWFIRQHLHRRDREGVWTQFDLRERDHGNRPAIFVSPQGAVWAVSGEGVYCLRGDELVRHHIPADSSWIAKYVLTQTGEIFATARSSGVFRIAESRHRTFDIRDGLKYTSTKRLAVTGDSVIVSTLGLQPIKVDADGIGPVDVRELVSSDQGGQNAAMRSSSVLFDQNLIIHSAADGSLLALPMLLEGTGELSNNSLPIFRRELGGRWEPFKCEAWQLPINSYTFCRNLRDGSTLIGSRQGIAVLRGQELTSWGKEVCNIEAKQLPLAAFEDVDGAVWVLVAPSGAVRYDGKEVRVFPFPEPKEVLAGTFCRFAGELWFGGSEGLYRIDEQAQRVVRCSAGQDDIHSHETILGEANATLTIERFATEDIVGLETDIREGQMWVVTKRKGVFAVNQSLQARRVGVFEANDIWTVNNSTVGPEGQLWLATEEGALRFKPTRRSPLLAVDRLVPLTGARRDAQGKYQVICDEPVRFRVGQRDDSPLMSTRYRVNGGDWQESSLAESSGILEIRFATPGSKVVDFQCVDGEWNLSDIRSIQLQAEYSFWRNPLYRAAITSLGVGLTVGLCALSYFYFRSWRDRSRMREQLLRQEAQARQAAEEASNERELLLARVCHDLRNPLTVVGVVADLLEHPEADQQDDVIGLLNESADSMNYLTEQLLSYVKSRATTGAPQPTSCDIRRLLNHIDTTVRLRMKDQPVQFSVSVDHRVPDAILVDRNMLLEALNNVVDNAANHTQQGEISVSCELLNKETIEFRVTDTGEGISEADQEAIFQPFRYGTKHRRATAGSDGKAQRGVGLGMFIVKELARRMDGEVLLESALNEGTTVRIRLPLVQTGRKANNTRTLQKSS